jgi:anti-sigma B factor antagonist
MEIRLYEATGNLLVKLKGRIVLDECDRLKSTIVPAITPSVRQVNLDLSEVDFIDSAGLGVLVGIKVSSKKHGADLALLSPSRDVSNILVVSKLDSIFSLVTGPDARELINNLSQPQFERQPGGGNAAAFTRTPAVPAMPAAAPVAGAGIPAPGSPKEQIDRLCKDAVEHMRRGDYESAVNCYIEAIRIQPDYLTAHNNLAIVYEKKPQWQDKAIEAWKTVLEISSRNNDQKHIDRAQKHLNNLTKLG